MKSREEVNKIISNNIKRIMKEKHITNEYIYNNSNFSRSTISYLKNGFKNTSAYTLYQVAEIMNCSIIDFFKNLSTEKTIVEKIDDLIKEYYNMK